MTRWDFFLKRLVFVLEDMNINVDLPKAESILDWRAQRKTIEEVLQSLIQDANIDVKDALQLEKHFVPRTPLPAKNLNSMLLYFAYVDLLANGPRLG